jgi:hypothetical protein
MINWGGRKFIPANTTRNNRQNISDRDRLEDLLRPLGEKKYNTNTWIANVFKEPESGPAPTPFVPSSLGDLQLWFDASDTDTLSLVGGNTVDTWTSKGLVDVVMSASTVARRPGYTTTGGEGGNAAVILYSASTPSNRSGMISEDYSKSVNLTSGYTYIVMGKNISSKIANGVYNTSTLLNMWNTGSTNSYAGQLFTSTQRNYSDYLQTGATTGFIHLYQSTYSTSAFTNTTAYVLNSLAVNYSNLYPGQNFGKNIISGNTISSSISTSGLTSYTGKTIQGFGIGSTKSTGTESSSVLSNFEVYEILLYNKRLTDSELNQVENYLRDKWQYSVNTSNVALVNINYTGKTNQSNDYLRFIYTPSQTAGQFAWNNANDIIALPTGVTITFDNTITTANIGINYTLKDQSNYNVLTQSCYDLTDKTVVLSAGTYNFVGNLDYSCVFPSPTPTMTPTQTPTPTPTPLYFPTTIYVNYTGDSNSYLYGRDDFGNTGFTITGAVTTAFTWTDFVVTNQNNAFGIYNSAGAKMSFNRYYADCSTGAPTSSLVDSRTCISEEYGWTNDLGGTPLGYCEVFDIWFDNSCP